MREQMFAWFPFTNDPKVSFFPLSGPFLFLSIQILPIRWELACSLPLPWSLLWSFHHHSLHLSMEKLEQTRHSSSPSSRIYTASFLCDLDFFFCPCWINLSHKLENMKREYEKMKIMWHLESRRHRFESQLHHLVTVLVKNWLNKLTCTNTGLFK